MPAPGVTAAAELVDRLDWCTPDEVLEHLAIAPDGLAPLPLAAVDPVTGRTVARCSSFLEVDVLDQLAATRRTEPALAALVPVPCRPDHTPDHPVHFRTGRLFGERNHP